MLGNLDCNGRRRDAFDCYAVDAGAICNSSPLLKVTADDRPRFRFRFGVERGLVIGATVSSLHWRCLSGPLDTPLFFIVVLRCSSGFSESKRTNGKGN